MSSPLAPYHLHSNGLYKLARRGMALPQPFDRVPIDHAITAQNRQVLDGASRADVVSGLVDFSGERLGTGQTEDVVDAVVLTPRHRLRPSVVPVATERNSRLVPPRPDMPYQAAQMGTHLDAAWRLARPQDDRHGSALLRVVDVDRQEAAFVIMSVKQRELLMAVDDIAGIIDVERDGCRLARVAIHPCVDQSVRSVGS